MLLLLTVDFTLCVDTPLVRSSLVNSARTFRLEAAGARSCQNGATAVSQPDCAIASLAADMVVPSASCSASSEFRSGGYPCENAFDADPNSDWATDGEGVGSWIQSNFGAEYSVNRFEYNHRNPYNEDNRQITLSFSDGSSQAFVLQNNSRDIQSFAVSPVQTSFVRLMVDSVYETVNNGARQIIFHGQPTGRSSMYLLLPPPCGPNPPPHTCTGTKGHPFDTRPHAVSIPPGFLLVHLSPRRRPLPRPSVAVHAVCMERNSRWQEHVGCMLL